MKWLLSILCLVCSLLPPVLAEDMKVAWIDGKDYVPIRELARVYGCVVQGPEGRSVHLHNKWNRITFTTNGRETQVNGVLVWLHEPMTMLRGRWMIRAADARKVLDPILRPQLHLRSAGYRVVVLDPGHGGQDTGARGRRGVEEKRAVLDISRRVRAQLQNAGVRVYMTRESDRFIELDERCRKAKAWGGDLFVSIHLNSAVSPLPGGTETYVLTSAGYASTSGGTDTGTQAGNRFEGANSVLGYSIQRALTQRINEGDRGLKRARFLVLKNAPCPAALVECAFVSNRSEEERLLGDEFREAIAEGISRGILNYLNAVKRARLEEP